MELPTLQNAGNLRGKRVLLRLDLNLPIVRGKIQDEYRLQRSLPTLEYLKKQGAKTIILCHTDSKETDSLLLVAKRLNAFFPIKFLPDFEQFSNVSLLLEDGEFLLLENIRRNAGEMSNDEVFTKRLASLGDIYVNDAFATSQRKHASIVGIPKFLPSYAGLLLKDEVSNLSKAFNPPHPFLFILAGANKQLTKGSSLSATKFPLIAKFLERADTVVVGGALANDVYRARGYETGVSLVSDSPLDLTELMQNPKLYTPVDVLVRSGKRVENKGADAVLQDERIVDAGEGSLEDLRELIEKASFVLWNGPLGEYEEGFDAGTVALAQELAECDAETIIGGGDSLAIVSKLGLLPRFSFVSTGGGAMLEFLTNGTLPGIDALIDSH